MNKINIWNKYSKIRVLHSGNFSKTYKAKNIKTQNLVAIKEINKFKLVKPVENLLEEIEKLLKIKENILTIKEIIDSGDFLYIVMDLCLINLEEYLNIRDKSFSINEIKTLLIQINNCLKILKDNNIKIENIKLSHILISLDEIDKISIKLSNFNLNQYMNDENTLNLGTQKKYFTTPPEILKEDLFDDKNNIWSLGVIIYYLINKKYPYEGNSENQLYNNIILNDGKIKLSEDKVLNDLLDKMLKIDINERINWDDYFNHSFFEVNKFPKFNILCKIHLKQFNFYCINCKKNICELCINEHPFESHNVISFSLIGLNDYELIEIENLFQNITNSINKLNQIKENISSLINKRKLCKENIFTYKNDMKNNFIKYYIDCLDIINQQLKFDEKIDIINIQENYIICNYNIKESEIDEHIQILNCLDTDKMNALKKKLDNCTLNINQIEMEKSCELYLNEKKINFSTKYEFDYKGDYKIKIINTRLLTNLSFMFSSCSSLLTIDFSNFNTSNINNMYSMFSKCSSLITLNLSNFKTSKVTNMMGMFYNCYSLTNLDLTNFNTSNVTNMMGMFYGCYSLISLNLCSFNTIKVTNMNNMFSNCSSLTSLDLSNFNTNNVLSMSGMFSECYSLTILNISNFNTNNKKININNIFDNVNKNCKIICNDEKIKQIQHKKFE